MRADNLRGNEGNAMKILVTDDEKEIRKILTLLLSSQGYEVVVAEDGEGAVEMLKADGSIDLCIMDIMMPELDGFSSCREIRKHSSVPIIMLSAKGEVFDKVLLLLQQFYFVHLQCLHLMLLANLVFLLYYNH